MDRATLSFAQHVVGAPAATWDESTVRHLATQVAPDGLGGISSWLLRGDANYLWARWFLESLADPTPYLAGKKHYPHLYQCVSDALSAEANQLPADERRELAGSLAKLLWQDISGRIVGRRAPADRETRLFLWDMSCSRCWICGAEFNDWARAEFLREESDSNPQTLPFIDFYKPRGKKLADLRIEVEHVVPHSGGGASDLRNLRLSCGWCNRAKSNRTLLYDAEGVTRKFHHPALGSVSIPQPFWVVRFLAMRGRCEDTTGCAARTTSDELTVAPRSVHGAPNPANLMVVCREHDPLRDARLVARKFVLG